MQKEDRKRNLLFRRTGIFLGALPKFRKAAISFILYVCPSRWNNSAATDGSFMKF
jgi:hypothetical protein